MSAKQINEERRKENGKQRFGAIETEEDREQQRDNDVVHLMVRQLTADSNKQ